MLNNYHSMQTLPSAGSQEVFGPLDTAAAKAAQKDSGVFATIRTNAEITLPATTMLAQKRLRPALPSPYKPS